ncbi:glycosyl transferase family 2 [Archangium sp. Cb G35]|uniref:DUF2304 family protein n=1 Tax=Archangium sp. Cb G35 TaxID=1920190 RepID=UPI000935A476|nr:DUF2304 family protein [Archangium sp. Cb G35]OJT20097.1 glycosyl transferase family 2 [Archangium sp. Cb G35]
MSPLFIAVLVGFFALVFSQFGARLAARHSVSWYLISAFIFVASVRPQWLRPLADLMGIQLISNLVLAVLTMFLFAQMLEQYSESTRSQRQMVRLVASLAAQNFPLPTSPRSERPRVLVVLPCYNEAENLPHLVPQLLALKRSTQELELDFCIINDGSIDATPALLGELAPANHVTHHTNIGVAGVLRTGFEIARRIGADYAIQCDSDGQHPIQRIPGLVRIAQERGVDMLIGSRFASGGDGKGLESTTKLRRMGGIMVSTTLRLFRGARVEDPTSGFRVYSRRAMNTLLRQMPDEYPEPEAIALVALARLRIEETHVTMMPRTLGTSSISGLKSARFMTKVTSALLGLRMRTLFRDRGEAAQPPVVSLPTPAAEQLPASRARASGE